MPEHIALARHGRRRKPDRAALGPHMLAMLRARHAQRRSDEFVFPGLPKDATKPRNLRAFGKLTKHFLDKIKDADGALILWSPHDLRRTALTVLESMDVSAYALKRIAAHSDGGDVTAGYLGDDVNRLRGPIERLEAVVFGDTSGKVVALDSKSAGRRRH